jgi:hypothetical protein
VFEKRGRHVTSKSWHHRRHPKRSLPLQNAQLQQHLLIDQRLREVLSHAVDVAHSLSVVVSKASSKRRMRPKHRTAAQRAISARGFLVKSNLLFVLVLFVCLFVFFLGGEI